MHATGKRNGAYTHGLSHTPTYMAWIEMRRRCEDTRRPNFAHYGARGIRVCKRWATFANFLKDMGPRPTPRHSLGRRNNEGHYTPRNCRWETLRQQGNNKRNNVRITARGRTRTLAQWSRIIGIDEGTLWRRHRAGWPRSQIVTRPLAFRGQPNYRRK